MTNLKPRLILEKNDGREAVLKLDYEHVVDALIVHLQTYPFALPGARDIIDLDLGLELDDEGYVTVGVTFAE
jgi:hypothetical protein